MPAQKKADGTLETPEEQKAREDKEKLGSPLSQQLAMVADPKASNAQRVGAGVGTLISALTGLGKKKKDDGSESE